MFTIGFGGVGPSYGAAVKGNMAFFVCFLALKKFSIQTHDGDNTKFSPSQSKTNQSHYSA
jgi:hypothetical protein